MVPSRMALQANRTRPEKATMKRKSIESTMFKIANIAELKNIDRMEQNQEKWFLCPPEL